VSSYRDLKQFVRDRPGHDRRYGIDAGKIRRELGWQPRRAFLDGVRDTCRWYFEHLDWYTAGRIGYDRERLGLGVENV
jgi:dTDP-glucose 4,6-dehydratase